MRVRLAVGTADSGGTDKFGELFLRPGTTRERVFRNAAFPVGPPDLLNLGQDAGSRDVDPTNPSHTPSSTTRVNADLFDSVTDAIGPFGFAFSEYQIIPQPGAAPRVHRGPTRYPPFVPHQPRDTLRVANFNMENLFAAGMVDDGHTFTQREVDAKTTRLADAVGHVLRRPDVVVTEEVASPIPLAGGGAQAARLHRHLAGVDRRAPHRRRPARQGRRARSPTSSSSPRRTRRRCRAARTTRPRTSSSSARRCRSTSARTGSTSRSSATTSRRRATRSRAARPRPTSCTHAAAALEAAGRQVMVIGDLNDFEDSPALTQNLVAPGVTLQNLWSEAPADNRYSFQFDGQLQTLDHIFVTDGLHAAVRTCATCTSTTTTSSATRRATRRASPTTTRRS